MNIYPYILVFLAGFIIGYIVKDLITIEKKVEVSINKQKVRGKGNTLTSDMDVTVDEKKQRKGLFSKLKERKLRNINN
jgi:uncharacterized membrane protein YciS (DUF1049 family)